MRETAHIVCVILVAVATSASHAAGALFPTGLPERQWVEFSAEGFAQPVSGVIYRPDQPPCCGMPLGGLSTGCIDLDVAGVWGMSTIFSDFTLYCPTPEVGLVRGCPRRPPSYRPFLGLSVGGKTWVLTTPKIAAGGGVQACVEPLRVMGRHEGNEAKWVVDLPPIEGVETAREIHYWGHYPVADLEFETSAPIAVGLRAWAPFLPGDAVASNIPGAVFEVHLRNLTGQPQRGAIALSLPGPDKYEARGAAVFRRQEVEDGSFTGLAVAADAQVPVEYALGVIGGPGRLRLGTGLGSDGAAWAGIGKHLRQAPGRVEAGATLSPESGASAAVDFKLRPGEEQVVRFVLAWYAPMWVGQDEYRYTYMYASRYSGAFDVARHLARDHGRLLRRVLAWQDAIYASKGLPLWLRDALVNNLALIPEDSFWTQPNPPMEWIGPDGFFGLLESPRGCPQIECIPCSWYGNQPIVYFFPELAHSTLKAYTRYITPEGEAPFTMSGWGVGAPYMSKPGYGWQVTLNGTCYADLVDRMWLRTNDDELLREFYDGVKRTTIFTMNLRPGPEGVIAMPSGNRGMEWFEAGQWAGMCAHLGGLHLAQLRMAERMAERMGDEEFVRQCQEWLRQGSQAMEEKMWTGSYYLNFWEPGTGAKSDEVMAYQLDGQWAADFHGVPGVFRGDRVKEALATIKRCNVPHAICGAINFARPDGSILNPQNPIAAYGTHGMFPPEVLVLAMTYIYEGERDFGLELARRSLENIICRQRLPWDQPNLVRGDTGERQYGTDYYQNMMLWSMPAALAGEDLAGPCRPGGLVDRVLKAARGL